MAASGSNTVPDNDDGNKLTQSYGKKKVNCRLRKQNSDHLKSLYANTLMKYIKIKNLSELWPLDLNMIKEHKDNIRKAKQLIERDNSESVTDYQWRLMENFELIKQPNSLKFILLKKVEGETKEVIDIMSCFDHIEFIHTLEDPHLNLEKTLAVLNPRLFIPKIAVEMFVSMCDVCNSSSEVLSNRLVFEHRSSKVKNTEKKKSVISTISISKKRAVVDIVSLVSQDFKFTYVLMYKNLSTKNIFLRPLLSLGTTHISLELFKIFANIVIPEEIDTCYRNLSDALILLKKDFNIGDIKLHIVKKITNEDMRRTVLNKLQLWSNNTKCDNWAIGCYFVQHEMNRRTTLDLYPSSSKNDLVPDKKDSGTELKIDLIEENILSDVKESYDSKKVVVTYEEDDSLDALLDICKFQEESDSTKTNEMVISKECEKDFVQECVTFANTERVNDFNQLEEEIEKPLDSEQIIFETDAIIKEELNIVTEDIVKEEHNLFEIEDSAHELIINKCHVCAIALDKTSLDIVKCQQCNEDTHLSCYSTTHQQNKKNICLKCEFKMM